LWGGLGQAKFVSFTGSLTTEEFHHEFSKLRSSSGGPLNPLRFFMGDGELFGSEGKTWALSNQWSKYQLPDLDRLIENNPQLKISYAAREE
jgi:hypothetical protein